MVNKASAISALVRSSNWDDFKTSRCFPQQVMVHMSRLPTLRAMTGGRVLNVWAAARIRGTEEEALRGRMPRALMVCLGWGKFVSTFFAWVCWKRGLG